VLEALAQRPEARVLRALAQPLGDLDFNLLSFGARVGRAEHRLEQVRVENQRLEVVAHRIDMHTDSTT
jgi:hypothetical protein